MRKPRRTNCVLGEIAIAIGAIAIAIGAISLISMIAIEPISRSMPIGAIAIVIDVDRRSSGPARSRSWCVGVGGSGAMKASQSSDPCESRAEGERRELVRVRVRGESL